MADTPSDEQVDDTPPETPPTDAAPPAPDKPSAAQTAVAPAPPTVDAPSDAGEGMDNLHRMLDIPLDMTVELGRAQMPLSEVLRLDTGSVVAIDRLPGEPIDLLINGRVFARGEVVVINDTFGFRVTELLEQGRNDLSRQEGGG